MKLNLVHQPFTWVDKHYPESIFRCDPILQGADEVVALPKTRIHTSGFFCNGLNKQKTKIGTQP